MCGPYLFISLFTCNQDFQNVNDIVEAMFCQKEKSPINVVDFICVAVVCLEHRHLSWTEEGHRSIIHFPGWKVSFEPSLSCN